MSNDICVTQATKGDDTSIRVQVTDPNGKVVNSIQYTDQAAPSEIKKAILGQCVTHDPIRNILIPSHLSWILYPDEIHDARILLSSTQYSLI